MVRRVDFDDGSGSVSDHSVRIGAGGVGAAAEDDGLGEELNAEAGGGGEDAVHADAGRRRRAFVSAEHGFQQIGLHGLYADAGAFRGEVERGAGGSPVGEGGVAGVEVPGT